MKYINVQLILSEYYPDQLKKGMYFVKMDGLVQEHPYVHIYELDKIPRDQGAYIENHGPPVEPYLMMTIDSNPDVPPKVVATPDEIVLSVDEINFASSRGYIEILAFDNDEPLLEKKGKDIYGNDIMGVVFYIDHEYDEYEDEE
jgi:hypothetical protein